MSSASGVGHPAAGEQSLALALLCLRRCPGDRPRRSPPPGKRRRSLSAPRRAGEARGRRTPPPARPPASASPPTGPGSLVRDGGQVLVNVRFSPGFATPAVTPSQGGSSRSRSYCMAFRAPASRPSSKAGPASRGRRALLRSRRGTCEGGPRSRRGLPQLRRRRRPQRLRPRRQRRDRRRPLRLATTPEPNAATDAHGDVLSGDLPGPAGNPAPDSSCRSKSLPRASPARRTSRRGQGDAADRPRPRPGSAKSPSPPPSKRIIVSPKTSNGWPVRPPKVAPAPV